MHHSIGREGNIMRHGSLSLSVVAAGLLAGATAAQAGNESWVSGTGTDTGTCTRTAPCRTFQFAHDQTSNNGAINVLTSGNFGPVFIDKPISIVADGVEAVINTGFVGAGITVNVGAAAVVSLRGLTIDMRGASINGITFEAGGALHVSNSVIHKTLDGIRFVNASGTSELYVSDTVISEASQTGNIFVGPSGSGSARVVLDRVRAENSSNIGFAFNGGFTTGSITATVRDSVSAGNGTGVSASEDGGGTVSVMIDRSAIVSNTVGISANGAGTSTIRIGDSTVAGNTGLGLSASGGGAIDSYGTNKVNGNNPDGDPTDTIAMK